MVGPLFPRQTSLIFARSWRFNDAPTLTNSSLSVLANLSNWCADIEPRQFDSASALTPDSQMSLRGMEMELVDPFVPPAFNSKILNTLFEQPAASLLKSIAHISPPVSVMADPLSITASMLAVITATVQSVRSLHGTIKRFRDRDKTLRRLQNELEDLTNILSSLGQVMESDMSMLTLLQDPIKRCNQVCYEFEQAMARFSGNPATGFRDWAKLEFMRGDVNEFIDTIAGYKSTISVGLGTINMHSSKVSEQVLQEYNEMVQDTTYNLEIHLRRIDEKLARFTLHEVNSSDENTNLKDEREVTKRCLRICEDAKGFLESLHRKESVILQDIPQSTVSDDNQNRFEAQLLTHEALSRNRDGLVDIIGRLQERLSGLVLNGDRNNKERLALQEDIQISRQCLEVCNLASEASRQKVYRIGEVVADGDSDQVVVTTLADLFDIGKAQSKDNSAQLVGSMTEEALRNLTDKRYSSRFGAVATDSGHVITSSSSGPFESQTAKPAPINVEDVQSQWLKERRNKHSPNEMKRRVRANVARSEENE